MCLVTIPFCWGTDYGKPRAGSTRARTPRSSGRKVVLFSPSTSGARLVKTRLAHAPYGLVNAASELRTCLAGASLSCFGHGGRPDVFGSQKRRSADYAAHSKTSRRSSTAPGVARASWSAVTESRSHRFWRIGKQSEMHGCLPGGPKNLLSRAGDSPNVASNCTVFGAVGKLDLPQTTHKNDY
jgi:hypothetical protein